VDLSVIVATFGDRDHWDVLADRAVASAVRQASVIRSYGPSLHEARNAGAAQADTEWLVFLDADDELEPGFVDALELTDADLRAPLVAYVENGHHHPPRLPRVSGHQHDCIGECLMFGNWLVIGTAVRRSVFDAAGGFRDWPCYEDWDLWLRCWQQGATVAAAPAVYRAHVRPDSRNRGQLSSAEKHRVHQRIAEANRVPVPV
jgi:glycosyltransferase involved in cell wall biosynthesis